MSCRNEKRAKTARQNITKDSDNICGSNIR